LVLLHCCFTVSTCCQNLELLLWNTFPHILRQTDHCVIIDSSLSIYLFCWLNYEGVVLHAALLEVAISPFLEMLDHKVVLMWQMDTPIHNWIVSLWDVSGFSLSKCLLNGTFVDNSAAAMIFFKNLCACWFSSWGNNHCAWSLCQVFMP